MPEQGLLGRTVSWVDIAGHFRNQRQYGTIMWANDTVPEFLIEPDRDVGEPTQLICLPYHELQLEPTKRELDQCSRCRPNLVIASPNPTPS
jgi:hypothetical protein